MEFEHEQREARRLLDGIENGTMIAAESRALIERADPTLVYFVITWLRHRYQHNPASEGVLGRIATLLRAYPDIARTIKAGEDDAVVAWFEDEYQYRDLSADQFVRIVVEKLES